MAYDGNKKTGRDIKRLADVKLPASARSVCNKGNMKQTVWIYLTDLTCDFKPFVSVCSFYIFYFISNHIPYISIYFHILGRTSTCTDDLAQKLDIGAWILVQWNGQGWSPE